MNIVDKFAALMKAGKNDEAQALIEAEKVKAKYEPDIIQQDTGQPARFTKKGKPVKLGDDDIWRLVK